jgi:uncharacterized protein YbaR (Trm112 family)
VTTQQRYGGLENLLVCPRDHGPLVWRYREKVVHNPRLRVGYPIRDGIAQLLEGASFPVDERGDATGGDRG